MSKSRTARAEQFGSHRLMRLARAVPSARPSARSYSVRMGRDLWFKFWVGVLGLTPVILTVIVLFWR